jgi:hypothetical protein
MLPVIFRNVLNNYDRWQKCVLIKESTVQKLLTQLGAARYEIKILSWKFLKLSRREKKIGMSIIQFN